MDCPHTETERLVTPFGNGEILVILACTSCGELLGKWVEDEE